MFKLSFLFVCIFQVCAASAFADQYWIAYEGNDFPENEGWARVSSDGGATRTIENGSLVLDSRQNVTIVDFYNMERGIDPKPGEMFVMEWGLSVLEISAREDPTVVVFSDEFRAIGFEFGDSYLINAFEPQQRVSIAPLVPHDFVLTSLDMRSFQLRIDGSIALEGDFFSVFNASRVSWGDGVQGSASLSSWNYFRFGVVPEPVPCYLLVAGVAVCRPFLRKENRP